MNSTTEYRDVPGFPGYRVGDDGSVWSCWARGGRGRRKLTGRWLQKIPDIGKKGYCRVELYRHEGPPVRFLLHALVLTIFGCPCPEGMECRHLDGNNQNNAYHNLAWGTSVQNWEDKRAHGNATVGIVQTHAKLNDQAVLHIRSARAAGIKLRVLADQYGVSMAKISQVARGQSWRHVNG